jgi:hypothetical protein
MMLIATIFALVEIFFHQSIGFGFHRAIIVIYPLIAPILIGLPIFYLYKSIRGFNRANAIALIALNTFNFTLFIFYISFVWIDLFNMAMSV